MTSGRNRDQSADRGKGYRALIEYLWVLGVVFLFGALAFTFEQVGKIVGHDVHSANLVMIHLLGVLIIATRTTRGPAVFGALASVLAFDFWFIDPVYSFFPDDKAYVTVVVVMMVVALLVNELSQRALHASRELEKARLEAESERLKNTLLRSVSHDLRTPLASIMGASSSLLASGYKASSELSGKHKIELTSSIYSESQRLERLVANLLEMTRIESGMSLLRKEWDSVEDLIGSALSSMEMQLRSRNVQLEIEPDLPLIEIDEVLMKQVLLNLLDNCIRYAPKGSYKISARRDGNDILITVHNSGSTIKAGQEERIFEKFYRADNEVRGSGLGLAICRGIIALHGGKIWAASGEDGVAMNFTIPVPESQPELDDELESEASLETR